MAVVLPIFRCDWSALTPDDVKAFLAEAGDEGLVWEAKGHTETRPDQIRRAVCGFANSAGGYLLIGAERDRGTKRWSLPGVPIGPDEPGVWIDNVIRNNGVRPVPRFEIHSWPRGDARSASVVMVEPMPITPCIALDGGVYIRTSGKTERVTDPAVMVKLIEGGRQAEQAAAELAARACGATKLDDGYAAPWPPGAGEPGESKFALALVAAAYAGEVGRSVFTKRFEAQLCATVDRDLWPGDPTGFFSSVPELQQTQNQVTALLRLPNGVGGPFERGWRATVGWRGDVCVQWTIAVGEAGIRSAFDDYVPPAWRAAVALVEALDGYGPARLAFWALGRGKDFDAFPSSHRLIERRVGLRQPDESDIDDVRRELRRAAGLRAYEPEPEGSSEANGPTE